MAFFARQLETGAGRQCAERDALINLDVVADVGRLTDNHAGAVVDKEVLADGCAGVDVNAGTAVRMLGHDARDIRNVPDIQLMCNAVRENCTQSRIRQNNLFFAARSRIAVESCFHVDEQQLLQARQLCHQLGCGFLCAKLDGTRTGALLISQRRANLRIQPLVNAVQHLTREIWGRGAGRLVCAKISRKQQLAEII